MSERTRIDRLAKRTRLLEGHMNERRIVGIRWIEPESLSEDEAQALRGGAALATDAQTGHREVVGL